MDTVDWLFATGILMVVATIIGVSIGTINGNPRVDKTSLYTKCGIVTDIRISADGAHDRNIVTFVFADNSMMSLYDKYPATIADGALTLGAPYNIVYQKVGNDYNILGIWLIR